MQQNKTLRLGLFFLMMLALIVLCYYFVDKPVAELAYHQQWRRFVILKWFTFLSPLILYLSYAMIIYTAIRRCKNSLTSTIEKIVFIASVNTVFTVQIKELLKYVFGRTWPATWISNNPSWLNNHVYGFHFFHGGAGYASFPSGHTAIAFAMLTVLWIHLPKWRWLCAVICCGIGIGLIGMYYHFVSDVLAGGLLGIITGTIASHAFLEQ